MLANRYVRTILLSRVLLQLGVWIRNFSVLLYVTTITNNSSFYVSLISVVEYAPIFLFALIGGTFADRWRPKRTMVWSDLLSAVSVVGVLIALQQGAWMALLLGTLVSASLSQFSQPSGMKLYKTHVPPEQLQGVMALSQSLIATFMVIGPIIGSFLYLKFGIETSLLITGVLFFGSALILSTLPQDVVETKQQAGASFLADLSEGIRYIRSNKALRTLSATFATAGLASGLTQPLLLFIALEKLGQDKQFLQWLLMCGGAAMLVGGGVVMGIAKRVKPQVLLATGLVVSAICTIGAGFSTLIPLTIGLQILNGLFYPSIQVGIQTLLITNTDAALIGRVGGAITPIFMGMMVIGMSIAGSFKEAYSLETVYSVSGTLLVIGALLLLPLFRGEGKKQSSRANGL